MSLQHVFMARKRRQEPVWHWSPSSCWYYSIARRDSDAMGSTFCALSVNWFSGGCGIGHKSGSDDWRRYHCCPDLSYRSIRSSNELLIAIHPMNFRPPFPFGTRRFLIDNYFRWSRWEMALPLTVHHHFQTLIFNAKHLQTFNPISE